MINHSYYCMSCGKYVKIIPQNDIQQMYWYAVLENNEDEYNKYVCEECYIKEY